MDLTFPNKSSNISNASSSVSSSSEPQFPSYLYSFGITSNSESTSVPVCNVYSVSESRLKCAFIIPEPSHDSFQSTYPPSSFIWGTGCTSFPSLSIRIAFEGSIRSSTILNLLSYLCSNPITKL